MGKDNKSLLRLQEGKKGQRKSVTYILVLPKISKAGFALGKHPV